MKEKRLIDLRKNKKPRKTSLGNRQDNDPDAFNHYYDIQYCDRIYELVKINKICKQMLFDMQHQLDDVIYNIYCKYHQYNHCVILNDRWLE